MAHAQNKNIQPEWGVESSQAAESDVWSLTLYYCNSPRWASSSPICASTNPHPSRCGHRQRATGPCNPALLFSTAQMTPGICLLVPGLQGSHQHHPVTLSHAALTVQSPVSKWAEWFLREAVWAILGKIRWLTFMPSNQMQTVELSMTQNGSTVFSVFPAHILRFTQKPQRKRGNISRCFCPISLIKDLNLFYRRLLETNYNISCTFFFFH